MLGHCEICGKIVTVECGTTLTRSGLACSDECWKKLTDKKIAEGKYDGNSSPMECNG